MTEPVNDRARLGTSSVQWRSRSHFRTLASCLTRQRTPAKNGKKARPTRVFADVSRVEAR